MTYMEFLKNSRETGLFSDLDLAFADFIVRMTGKGPHQCGPLRLLAALISRAFSVNREVALLRSCIARRKDLAAYLEIPEGDLPFETEEWLPSPADFPHIFSELPFMQEPETPLVLTDGRFYTARNLKEENFLNRFLLEQTADKLIPGTENPETMTALKLEEAQKKAVRFARNARFMVITGGPGTGKTTIIAMILALRKEPAAETILCAPTGKAQTRMRSALQDEIKNLTGVPDSRIKELSAISASTIHRLLKWNPEKGKFKYGKECKLPWSLVVVDECSMISQSLMTALIQALKPEASLILLGDSDQLASVDAGAVFGSFCTCLERKNTGNLVRLTVSHRFPQGGDICGLKDLINAGKAVEAWNFLTDSARTTLFREDLPEKNLKQKLLAAMQGAWMKNGKHYFEEETLEEAWKGFESFRILTPFNTGRFGTVRLNESAAEILEMTDKTPGNTCMVLTNNPRMGLFNGDTGILWYAGPDGLPLSRTEAAEQKEKRLLYFFETLDEQGNLKWRGFPQVLLPEHVPAFALTVHKSQGSGYGNVLLFLPDAGQRPEGIITRELVYTGVTRTRSAIRIFTTESTFKKAVARKTERTTGTGRIP